VLISRDFNKQKVGLKQAKSWIKRQKDKQKVGLYILTNIIQII
jgi:hypothetical protein